LAERGAKPLHITRILRAWLHGQPLDTGTRRQQSQDFLPLAVREYLPELAAHLDGLARLRSEHPGADDSARLLVELDDGQMVESVLLPREGLCVSSQVGCAVGCTFCMTGKSGLLRQVGSAEIVAQVALARRRRTVRKVVFMGMGEPAHNLDNVLEAIELLGTEAASATRTWCSPRWAIPGSSSACRSSASSRPWPSRCIPPMPNCAPGCCPAHRASRPRS